MYLIIINLKLFSGFSVAKGITMDQNQNPYTQPDFNQTNQPSQADVQNQQMGYQQSQPYQQPQQQYQQTGYQQPYQQPQQPYQQNNFQQQMPADSFGGFDQSYQAPVYTGEWRPVSVKKRINPLAIIIPAAVLVIAAVVILIIVLSNKPDYRKAEQNFFNNTFGTAMSSADNAASKLKNQAESLKIDFKSLSGSLDIPNFLAKIDAVPNGDNTYTEISFSMDGMDLDIQGWVDSAAETVHIFFPEISDIYAKFNLGDLMSQAYEQSAMSSNVDYDKYYDAMDRICGKVSDKYFELIGDPEVEKNQSFSLEGETYKADKCVIKLDSKQLVQLINVLFEAVADDDDLIDLIAEASDGEYSPSEVRSELRQLLDNLDSSLGALNENDFALEMTVYMRKNNIIGREIKIKVSGLNAVKLSFYDIPTNEGRIVAFKTGSDLLSLMNSMSSAYGDDAALVPMMSYESSANAIMGFLDMTFILEDKSNGDVHSGTATLTMGSVFSAELEYKDLALTENLCQGSATLTVSDMPSFGVDLELSKDGDNKVIELDITNVCTVTVTEGPSDLKYKELPDIPSDKLAEIDPNSSMYDDEAFRQLNEDLSRALGGYGVYVD